MGREVVATWEDRADLVASAEALTDPAIPEGTDRAAAVTAGATLFSEAGCLSCHLYLGAGSQNLGAPELTEEGLKGRGIEWQIGHIKAPSDFTPGSAMPPFANFTDEEYLNLAIFLEASRGESRRTLREFRPTWSRWTCSFCPPSRDGNLSTGR